MENFTKLLLCLVASFSARMCVPMPVPAQTDTQMRAIMTLTGASSEEELDSQEVEGYLHLLSHPLEINLAGRSKLISSGLMSRYQAASLEDYRCRNGDVLSFTELSRVEGFGEEYVAALRPFISLTSRSLPGALPDDSLRIRNDALFRTAFRGDGFNYGAKWKISAGSVTEATVAARTVYSDLRQFPPSSLAFNVTAYGRRRLEKVVAGDYNLRFSQGLLLLSGLSLTGFSSSASFSKRPTGLSPSYSWTGTGVHRGVAADFRLGRFVLTPFVSFPGLRTWCQEGGHLAASVMPGGSLGWYGRNGQVSLTGYLETGQEGRGVKVSADFRFNRKGKDGFGEVAMDLSTGSVAAVTGLVLPLGGGWKFGGVARCYQSGFTSGFSGGVRSWTKTSDELGLALGLEKYGIQLTADFAAKDSDRSVRQGKLLIKVPLQLTGSTVLSLRVTERVRPYEAFLKYRTGGRIDIDWNSAGISARYGESDDDAWKARFRVEGLLCRSLAGLSYLEGGRKTGRYAAYLRGTVFFVDNWDDRIYSYERDAPGSFNVPAYYGRGFSLSAVGGWKFRFGRKRVKALKLYFRASTVRYPFMDEPKPARTEFRVQAMASL